MGGVRPGSLTSVRQKKPWPSSSHTHAAREPTVIQVSALIRCSLPHAGLSVRETERTRPGQWPSVAGEAAVCGWRGRPSVARGAAGRRRGEWPSVAGEGAVRGRVCRPAGFRPPAID
ncbi:hypothetical protein GCM10010324_68250 [Streptomyces hiroshimensis]|uniref:Uncharacterized protein n=1 Tax=Streptomyces hiroshimensis TaxID=66424 RepID=A0ABQ2ZC13_9ACTN|nr:hypothetical protein GCM10010324_68250 [Streptomyces hiroshimensis]